MLEGGEWSYWRGEGVSCMVCLIMCRSIGAGCWVETSRYVEPCLELKETATVFTTR